MEGNLDDLVMGTVNAPWRDSLTAQQLAAAMVEGTVEENLLHLSTLYDEVRPELVLRFAETHDIPAVVLVARYRQVCRLTGSANRALEALLVGLG